MRKRDGKGVLTALCILTAGVIVLGGSINAAWAAMPFQLQVTEIWSGNEPDSNLSQDWFEVTNIGESVWTAASFGDLYFDDDSADPSKADLMSGIASIAPGESVIFVDGGTIGAADWLVLWSGDLVTAPQVGSYDGAGLGKNGDAVTLFVDDPDSGVNLWQLAFETYPGTTANGGQSYDVVLGAFSTVGNASGAVATSTVNEGGQPAIGSPGAVPEPGTIALMVLGAMTAVIRRR